MILIRINHRLINPRDQIIDDFQVEIIVVTQFKLYPLGQLGKQGVLRFGRKFREYQVALRLPFAPSGYSLNWVTTM